MKLTPSSTARRKTFFAFSRSGGQPQIPSPVRRIAPNPSRLTKKSSPNKNVSPVLLVLAAARSFGNPPVKTPAAPARPTSKNVLRFIAGKICRRYQFSTPLGRGRRLLRPVKERGSNGALRSHLSRQGTTPPWRVAL